MIAQLPMKPERQNRATNQQLVFSRFRACNFGADFANIDMAEGKAVALIGSMRPCKKGKCYQMPVSFSIDSLEIGRTCCRALPIFIFFGVQFN